MTDGRFLAATRNHGAIAQQAAFDRRELWISQGSYVIEHLDTLVNYFRSEGLKVTVYGQVPWNVRVIALGNLQQPFPVLHFQW